MLFFYMSMTPIHWFNHLPHNSYIGQRTACLFESCTKALKIQMLNSVEYLLNTLSKSYFKLNNYMEKERKC